MISIIKIRIVYLLLVALVLVPSAIGMQMESVSSEHRSLVPRQMLALLHAPEVHQELKLNSKQVTELESLFAEIDGPWFQLRNQSQQQQLPLLDSLDQRVHSWLVEHVTNCHANFEIYRRWHEQWREKGVVVVGIQTPETSQERDPAAVKSAAAERTLEFPIMVDVASKNWDAWGNTMWPTVYVVDKNGYLRQWWQGELNWKGATADKTIEQVVEQLLAEP